MSAVLRWRCDICQREAEVVEEVPRQSFTFYSPKLPTNWVVKRDGQKKALDVCSQACVVVWTQRLLTREQQKLLSTSPDDMPHSSGGAGHGSVR